jgi:uncharacterized protein
MATLPAQHRALELAELKPCEPYFGEPIGARPAQGIAVLHADAARGIVAGVWECAPGRLRLDIKSDEFCHIIKGHWLLKSAEGEVLEVRAGDSFFFPKGWQGECEVREAVRKVFTVVKSVG